MLKEAAALAAKKIKKVQSAYEKFQAQYFYDPSAFARDCFYWRGDEKLEVYQDEVLASIPEKKRVAVRAPRGGGKTAVAAIAILWFSLTRDGKDWKAPTTAGAWRQLTKFLWPEIHKWARRLRWDKIGREPFDPRTELQVQNLKLSTGEAFALTSDQEGTTEGAHADHILYLFDEAKIIPDSRWDSAEGTFSGAWGNSGREAYVLAISTPGEPVGRFYNIHQRKAGFEDWYVRHVNIEEVIAAGRITREWMEQRKKQWGEDSAIFQNHVLGEFCTSDELGVVPLAWLEAAYKRYDDWERDGKKGLKGLIVVGADIAEGGNNKTVLAPIYEVESEFCDKVIGEFLEFDHHGEKQTATMATCGRLVAMAGESRAKLVVDAVGIGAGVVHRLNEQKKNAIAFKGGEKCDRTDFTGLYKYRNKNAGAWHGVRDYLNPDNGHKIAICANDTLTRDLTTRRFMIRSDGVIEVESKDDLRKRLKSGELLEGKSDSPDYGDACAMAVFEMKEAVPSVGYTPKVNPNAHVRRSIL